MFTGQSPPKNQAGHPEGTPQNDAGGVEVAGVYCFCSCALIFHQCDKYTQFVFIF
jgi:hypothetical protein